MPKVKLSALVSDIKGKSNGSVFASNNGGLYFRNNPSGGGTKSVKWATQKSKFGTLSSQWKALSDDQRDAWIGATNNFPTLNAFGEPRYPTGYELFMKANGTLGAMGIDQLLVPGSPRATPVFPELELNIPDNYQYQPKLITKLYNPLAPTTFITSRNFFEDFNFRRGCFQSIRFIGIGSQFATMLDGQYNQLHHIHGQDSGRSWYYVQKLSDVSAQLLCFTQFENADGVKQTEGVIYYISYDEMVNGFHLVTELTFYPNDDRNVVVNGFKVKHAEPTYIIGAFHNPIQFFAETQETTYVGIPLVYDSNTATVVLGSDNEEFPCPYYLSDWRTFTAEAVNDTCNVSEDCGPGSICQQGQCFFTAVIPDTLDIKSSVNQNWYKVFLGYVLGFENTLYGLDEYDGNGFVNYGRDTQVNPLFIAFSSDCGYDADCLGFQGASIEVSCYNGDCVYIGDGSAFMIRNQLTYSPMIMIKYTSVGEENWSFILKSSGQISAGKNIKQVKYNKFSVIPVQATNFLLTSSYKSLVGNTPGESTSAFKIALVDNLTGIEVNHDLPIKSPKYKPRFKAGAELSGKVN